MLRDNSWAVPSIFLPPQFQYPPEHCTASFFGHAGECSLNCCASLHWRMEIRGDIHLQPKQPTLHNLPTYLPFSVPTHAQWRMCACGPSSAPAAFLDGRGRQGRYLASPSWNDKKARSPFSSPRSLALASHAPLSLPELRRGMFKKLSKFEETGA